LESRFFFSAEPKGDISVKEKQGLEIVRCKEHEISDLFVFYVNGDVSVEETARIESHVSSCAECQSKLSFVMAVSECGLPSWRSGNEERPGSRRNSAVHSR
jgi:hypothetical protein